MTVTDSTGSIDLRALLAIRWHLGTIGAGTIGAGIISAGIMEQGKRLQPKAIAKKPEPRRYR